MTLADEDTNSILADNDNWAIQGNVAMQVEPSEPMQVVPLGDSICKFLDMAHDRAENDKK